MHGCVYTAASKASLHFNCFHVDAVDALTCAALCLARLPPQGINVHMLAAHASCCTRSYVMANTLPRTLLSDDAGLKKAGLVVVKGELEVYGTGGEMRVVVAGSAVVTEEVEDLLASAVGSEGEVFGPGRRTTKLRG